MLYKSELLTLETIGYSWDLFGWVLVYGPKWPFYSWIVILDCWDRLCTGYVSRVELPVQRRLCPIFVRNVGSSDIHECFRGLTGSQRTPRIWGVTAWYQSLGIRIPKELGFG